MGIFQALRRKPFFIRLFHWEYWSFFAIYCWIYPVWFWYCLRARSLFFFAASNPGIKNGGFLNESKRDLAEIIPPEWHPRTVFFNLPANGDRVVQELDRQKLDFPLVGKPNIGGRGRGVKVLMNVEELKAYVRKASLDFHIQEFVSFKNEAGIFYYRFPGEARGHISGIVRKEFLKVRGDGKHTIRELMQASQRAIMYIGSMEKIHGPLLDDILPPAEERLMSPYGNHARGAMFVDDTALVDEDLTRAIDRICQAIPGFYYGRLDVRFASWDELKLGQNFSIIEVNGAGSEPTHMYDPRHSLFKAWSIIIRHWKILYQVSRLNHKAGHPYLRFRDGVAMFREDREWSRRLARMPE